MPTENGEKLLVWIQFLTRTIFAFVSCVILYFADNTTPESLLLPAAILLGGFIATPDRNYKNTTED